MKRNIKLKIWTTIIFMIVVCGCGERTTNKGNMGEEVIRLNPHDAAEYVNLSEIADSIICIKLQPAPDDIMGRVYSIFIRKKYIYAMDTQQQALFVFDKTGKFVSKLDKRGDGSDEYRYIKHVFIDDSEEHIELIDESKRRKLKYTNISFELVESVPFCDIRYCKCRMNNGFHYFATLQIDNVIDDKNTNAGLLVIDDKNNLKTMFDKDIEETGFYFYPIGECFAQNEQNELFFSNMYDNTFYRLEAGEASPVYTVDFGKYGINNEHVGALSMKKQFEYLGDMKGLAYMPVLNINNSGIMSFSYFFKQQETPREQWIISPEKDIRQYIRIKDKVYHVNKIRNDLTSFPDRLHICSNLYGLHCHEVWYEDYLVDVIATHNYFADSDVERIFVEGLGEVTSDEEIIIVLMKLKK
jgi:hypothetical protein